MPDVKETWAVINQGLGTWSPEAMENMSLDDLYQWYDLALEILEQKNEAPS